MEKPISFDEYKEQLLETTRLKLRTPQEKEREMNISREKARKAINKIDKDGTFGNPRKYYIKKLINILKNLIEQNKCFV